MYVRTRAKHMKRRRYEKRHKEESIKNGKQQQQLQLESCDLMTFFFLFFLTKSVDHYGLHLHTYVHTQSHS